MPEFNRTIRDVFRFAVLSCVSGALTGLLVAAFRLILRQADLWRNELIASAHQWSAGFGMPALVLAVASAAALSASLVRRFSPYAAGSGIPHVEAVALGRVPPAPLSLIPVKFIGGLLAIGGGFALGREGPSVQMGADIGISIGKRLGLPPEECVALLAACGGAGVATAFNSPIAGAVFVLEELLRRFDTRTTIAALGSSCCAIAVARLFLGSTPDFTVTPVSYAGPGSGLLFLSLGIIAGAAGAAYNVALTRSISWASAIQIPVELRAACIGAAVGLIAWFAPDLVGGGDLLTQRTLSKEIIGTTLPIVFAVRFLLGPVSYAAGTPGGLFAPMLVIGAQLGFLSALFWNHVVPHATISPVAFAVVGMAAFFTAVVRAPVTGIILVIELTASFTQLMPMLWACFGAMVIPTLLRNAPIYESLSQPFMQIERGG
jgi:CIC family chloride channel protein